MSVLRRGTVVVSLDSDISYLDMVQDLSDAIGKLMGFDADALYWIGLSLRESVTNAIQHGNKLDKKKQVGISFEIESERLTILVRDQGAGLEESKIPDPLNPDNLLKDSGRGIFFVRSFMDEVAFHNLPEGGLEVRMEKRVNKKGEKNDD